MILFLTQEQKNLNYHSKVCNEENSAQCFICGYKVVKRTMKKHLEQAHTVTKFKCELCDVQCSLQNDLTVHINAVHLGQKNFKCDVCDYKTGWPETLRKHKKLQCQTKTKNQMKCQKYTCV